MSEDTFVKEEMKRLWKENFHDSDQYVNLVFDAYYKPEMVEYEERDGKIAAALLGVPYCFGNANHQIKGIYLCGLSTDPDFRRRGIMTGLINRFINRIDTSEFPFVFLIPAGSGLQKYYHDRGFVNAFYRLPLHYVSTHSFKREFDADLDGEHETLRKHKKDRFNSLSVDRFSGQEGPDGGLTELSIKSDNVDRICIFINSIERSRTDMQIIHSLADVRTAINECVISGGNVFYAKDNSGEITAVAFLYVDDKEKTITVYYLQSKDSISRFRLLETIKRDFEGSSITLWNYPVRSEPSGLWQPFYGAVLPEAPTAGAVGESERGYYPVGHSQVYGMARILNLHEILKFQAAERDDLKYSILVKEGREPHFIRYRCQNGLVEREVLTGKLTDDEKRKILMTENDVAEILFRRPDSDPIVEEVMELPPLGGAISMMLD